MPKTDLGRRLRNVLATLALLRAMATVERMLPPRAVLPEYASAS